MSQPARVLPVILCGGAGRRLWPLSREARPKPFATLVGEGTLLQQTVLRVADPILFDPPLVVCNAAHLELARSQIEAIGLATAGFVAEPIGRDTAAAALLGALVAAEDEAGRLILILPSDHHVADPAAFRAAVVQASPAAQDGRLVVMGVRPDRPDTAYGYILPEPGAAAVRAVARFVEKPDAAAAAARIAEGALWNAGVVLARADRLIAEAERFRPDILAAVQAALTNGTRSSGVIAPDVALFAACRAEALDRAVLERTESASVVVLDAGWSDVGSYDAVWRAGGKDLDGVAAPPETIAIAAADCLVSSDGPLVALVGVRDLAVIVRDGVVLVVARDQDQRLKEVVEALGASGRGDRL